MLDTVIALSRPRNYSPDQGAVFEVDFEKSRALHGEDVAPFIARLTTSPDGISAWTTNRINEQELDQVAALRDQGLSQKEIAEHLGVHKSTISRRVKRARLDA